MNRNFSTINYQSLWTIEWVTTGFGIHELTLSQAPTTKRPISVSGRNLHHLRLRLRTSVAAQLFRDLGTPSTCSLGLSMINGHRVVICGLWSLVKNDSPWWIVITSVRCHWIPQVLMGFRLTLQLLDACWYGWQWLTMVECLVANG